MKTLTIVLAMVMTACAPGFVVSEKGAQGEQGAQGVQGEQGTQGEKGDSYVPPQPTAVEEVVEQVNEIREAQGYAPITKGLVCTAYKVPNSATQIIGATLTTIGSFLYKGKLEGNVLPGPMAEVVTSYYIVKCSGQLIVTTSEWREFTLTSDDGANLYINGGILNNDGLHSSLTKTYVKFLARGAHSIQVDYFQAGGLSAFQVLMNNEILNNSQLYH